MLATIVQYHTDATATATKSVIKSKADHLQEVFVSKHRAFVNKRLIWSLLTGSVCLSENT